jgi:hypothetical protein
VERLTKEIHQVNLWILWVLEKVHKEVTQVNLWKVLRVVKGSFKWTYGSWWTKRSAIKSFSTAYFKDNAMWRNKKQSLSCLKWHGSYGNAFKN